MYLPLFGMDAVVDGSADLHETGGITGETGEFAAVGSLVCVGCGYSISLSAGDELPVCPACGESRFRRASMFESPSDVGRRHLPGRRCPPGWMTFARSSAPPATTSPIEDDEEPVVVELQGGWTRIGRSGSADICLDDATVSRRHALIVRTPEDELRALDDRSLNGLFVNGEPVEWAPLSDGDELEIGRYRLYVVQV